MNCSEQALEVARNYDINSVQQLEYTAAVHCVSEEDLSAAVARVNFEKFIMSRFTEAY